MDIKSLEKVSKERILKEFLKTLAGPYFCEKGFPLMESTGIIGLIPGLSEVFEDMKTCNQNPDWHAEGAILRVRREDGTIEDVKGEDFSSQGCKGEIVSIVKCGTVYEHTLEVMLEMEKQLFDEDKKPLYDEHTRAILMLAAILHDIGKAPSARKNGKKSPDLLWGKTKDHDFVGAPLAYDFCKNLGMTNDDCDTIYWLVEHHMRYHQISEMKSKCRLWHFVSNPLFDMGIMLAKADERGCRKTKVDEWSGIEAALELDSIKELRGKPMPKGILTGDDLIKEGHKPGPGFKKALEKALENQINLGMTDKTLLYKSVKGIVKQYS